jgi:hypothetical protein
MFIDINEANSLIGSIKKLYDYFNIVMKYYLE